MDELLPTRCIVSPNEVEETRVWTGEAIVANIIPKVLATWKQNTFSK